MRMVMVVLVLVLVLGVVDDHYCLTGVYDDNGYGLDYDCGDRDDYK